MPKAKAKIINLSSLHSLRPIIPTGIGVRSGIGAFAQLSDKYSRGSCLSGCFRFFAPLPSLLWVGYIYNRDLSARINPYKLGLIGTAEFMEQMLSTFDFLIEETTNFTDEVWDRIEENKDNFVSTRNMRDLSKREIALALLEEAWNEIIVFSKQDKEKCAYLLEDSHDTPIYLIANTNELNVYRILHELRKEFPAVKWIQKVNLEHDNSHEAELIKVAPNISLCLSYKYHTFKTTSQNQCAQITGPSLFSRLVGELKGDISNIEVISEYDDDFAEARSLGFDEQNLIQVQDYFSVPAQGSRYVK